MLSKENLGVAIIGAAATGVITDPAEVQAMFAVLGGASMLRPTPSATESAVGLAVITNTLDANGDLLVAGRNYLDRGKKIKVLREEFGAGNIMDTYYRIYYLDADLEESFLVVQGSYPNGFFAGAAYKSKLIPA